MSRIKSWLLAITVAALAVSGIVTCALSLAPSAQASVAPTKPPLDAGRDGGVPLPPIPDGGPIHADAAQPMSVKPDAGILFDAGAPLPPVPDAGPLPGVTRDAGQPMSQ